MDDLESVKMHSVEHLLRASFTKSGRSQSRNPRILFHTTTVTRRRGAAPGFFRYMNEEDEEGRAEPTDTARDDSSPVGDEAPALAVETAATDDAVDLGSSSKQWRDIYTGDINLNNTKENHFVAVQTNHKYLKKAKINKQNK